MQIYVKILVLAIIQAAAELLPVSSSAHVILAEKLMGLDPSSPAMVFVLIMLHTGTMLAVIVYFWRRWKAQFFAGQWLAGSGSRFLVSAFLATVATGLLGLALQYLIERVVLERLLGEPKGEVEQLFKSLPLIGAALIVAGLLILLSSRFDLGNSDKQLTPARAILIGMVQALCLPFRGFSRSGATISVGLMCGLPRRLAEEFSFALAVLATPPVLVRQTWKLFHSPEAADTHLFDLLAPGLLGMSGSFLAGLVALRVLSGLLEGGRWMYFGIYCLIFAGLLFVAAWRGL
jgi:undecaprenyl-diphosphatase